MRKRQRMVAVLIVGGLAACAGRSIDDDALFADSSDANPVTVDGGKVDAPSKPDAESVDADPQDVNVVDVVTPDAAPDANAPDAKPDVKVGDASTSDASVSDAGAPDVGVPDVGVPDVGKPDADGGKDVAQPIHETTNALCSDGLDNDNDGFTDCMDYNCWFSNVTVCAKNEDNNATCSDGIDNDGDGFIDCQDYGCSKGWNVTVCKDAGPDPKDAGPDAKADAAKDTGIWWSDFDGGGF